MSDTDSDSSSSSSEDDKRKKKKKKDKKKKPEKTRDNAAGKCKWTAPQSALVIETLHELKAEGQQSESGWKETVWTVCADRLEEQFPDAEGAVKTAPKCQDHFTNLKGDFKIVKELRARSGMGWDTVNCTVTAAPDVWDKACKANAKFKKWRRKAFPLFDTLADLVGEVVATGEGALLLGKQSANEGKVKESKGKQSDSKSKGDKVQSEAPKKRRHSRTGSEGESSTVEIESSDDNAPRRSASASVKRAKTATGGHRPSGALAVQGVAGSLDRLGDTLADVLGTKAADASELKVATRRTEAIQLVSKMVQLTIGQRAAAVRLLADPTTVDLLLDIPDDELKVAFVEEMLSADARKSGTSRVE